MLPSEIVSRSGSPSGAGGGIGGKSEPAGELSLSLLAKGDGALTEGAWLAESDADEPLNDMTMG